MKRKRNMPNRHCIVVICAVLLVAGASSGCLGRRYYYEPTAATLSTGDDGLKRGAVKEEGSYPFWSDAPGKSFLNPTVSLVGKSIKKEED